MRLQRIYSSKLYRTNPRKEQIRAAMESPDAQNVELVQQLEDYLSDDAKAILHQAENEVEQENQANAAEASAPESSGPHTPSGSSAPSHTGGGAPHSSFTGDIMSDFGEDELADVEVPEDAAPAPETDAQPEPDEVVESVTQEGKPITSSTAIIWTTLDDVVDDCETIKGTLNAVAETSGVTRLEVKDSELWIYYNDDSNLNDKMVEVISVLNSTGYTYLKFNRLARSNNAIVFDITLNVEPIKSVKEIEEEQK